MSCDEDLDVFSEIGTMSARSSDEDGLLSENEFDMDYYVETETESDDDDDADYDSDDERPEENSDKHNRKAKQIDGLSFYFYAFDNITFTKSCQGDCRKASVRGDDANNNKIKKMSASEEMLKKVSHTRKPMFTGFVEDSNPIVDGFICCHDKYNSYAQKVCSDLETTLFSCEQISLLYEHNYLIRRKIGNTLKIVTTPDLVRNLNDAMEPLLLYSLVGCLPKGEIIFPVADKILRHKKSSFIESFFDEIKIHCREHKQIWPFCRRLTADVDFEVISAVLSHFNHMNVGAYLKLCYNMYFNKKGHIKDSAILPQKVVCVQFSASHCSRLMLHEVKNWVGEKKPKLLEFLTSSLRIVFNLFKISHCIIWFRRVCIVLLSPYWTKRVEDSFNALQHHPRRMPNLDTALSQCDESKESFESMARLRKACKRSPFKNQFLKYYLHCRMLCIKDNMEESGCSMTTKNVYYCPKMVKMIMDNCLAMLPFWSNIVGIKIEPNQFHTEQDEIIANFYNEIRLEHLGKDRLELGQFIRGYGDFVAAQIEDLHNYY